MTAKVTYKQFISGFIILAIMIAVVLFVKDDLNNANGIGILVVILSIGCIWNARKDKCLLVLFSIILYVNLSIVVICLFNVDNLSLSLWHSEINTRYIKCFLILMSVLYVATINIENKQLNEVVSTEEYEEDFDQLCVANPLLALLSFVVLTLIYATSFSFSTGGGYSSSSIYEYSIFFLILGWIYGSKLPWARVIWFLYAAFYVLRGFLAGDRSSAFMVVVLIALIYAKKIRLGLVALASIAAIFLANMIDTFRHIGIANVTISEMWQNALSKGVESFFSSTARSSYYTGLTILKLSEVYNGSHLALFFQRLVNVFSGSLIFNATDTNLVLLARNVNMNYGGGLYPSFFYFYGGYIGVFLSAVLLGAILQIVYTSRESKFLLTLKFLLPVMVLRWYLYSPMTLFRACLFMYGIIYIVYHQINLISSGRENR